MAPISTFVSTFFVAALALSSSVSGSLHSTRSRQHASIARRSGNGSGDVEFLNARADLVERVAEDEHSIEKRCEKEKKSTKSSKKSSKKSSNKSSKKSSSKKSSSSTKKQTTSAKASGYSNLIDVALPGGFKGLQTNSIGSWFRADNSEDSTNGRSWCGIEYTNDMPLFAPKLTTMSPNGATWSTDPQGWEKAASEYCGQAANVCYKGNCKTLFIGDSFDDRWVLTPTSIDILVGPWAELYGSETSNKDIVMEGLTWELTGQKNPEYAFKA